MAYSGKFKPKNWLKYKGCVDKIVWRSKWELTAFRWADNNPNVVAWSSEEKNCIIPYFDPVKNKQRRYFCDLWIKVKHPQTGVVKEFLCEIKPKKETVPPVQPKRKTEKSKKRYLVECATYATNSAKWEAALKFCKKKNFTFLFLTEDHLC